MSRIRSQELALQMASLLDHSTSLVAVYDADDRLIHANSAFRTSFFIEPTEQPLWPDLMRRNFALGRGTVITATDFEIWLRSAQSRRGKTKARAFETDHIDGRWLWMTETVDASGWMLCVAIDISGLRADGRRVRQDLDLAIKVACTDELTGVSNRRFVMARAAEMIAGAGGSVAVMDIDNFKGINDSFGHHAGDVVLQRFAQRIHRRLRRADVFGRIGGEEFLLVLPDTNKNQAHEIVERLRLVVDRTDDPNKAEAIRYTFSAGIAESQTHDDVASLYARADRALYAAKTAGRNRIECAA
jgi:diguanylate cyclase (GGDEF)-like protein